MNRPLPRRPRPPGLSALAARFAAIVLGAATAITPAWADAVAETSPTPSPTRPAAPASADSGKSRRRDTGSPTVNAAATDPFDAFRVIGERNIFNPNRTPRSPSRGSSIEAPSPSDEVITLVGTLDYEKGQFAFFDGSDSKYRKAIAEGVQVATFTVKRVAAQTVDLVQGDRAFTLRVAEQLRRRPGGEWAVVTAPAAPPASAPAASPATPGPAAAPSVPANASDTLRRMMEQRRKQLNKE